jgi:hypothetical protein
MTVKNYARYIRYKYGYRLATKGTLVNILV